MTASSSDPRLEIQALQADLEAAARRMTRDDQEAAQLLRLALSEAVERLEQGYDPGEDTRVWMFGVLRNAFHSVARRRVSRQERGRYAVQQQIDSIAADEVTA